MNYEGSVNFFIFSKLKDPNCSKDSACVAYWKKTEQDLLKDKIEIRSRIKNKVTELLKKRYSKAQIKWLLEVYKLPLFQDFRTFYQMEHSPLPFMEGRKILDEKKKNIPPFNPARTNPAIKK
jgi:hypothetical protein